MSGKKRFFACTVDACQNAYLARGYCAKHYERWKKHGDPLVVKKVATTPIGARGVFTQADCAWLACALDSEGSLTFGTSRKRVGLTARFALYNTHVGYMERAATIIQAVTGARPLIHLRVNGFGFTPTKPCYTLVVSSRAILNLLLPVLVPFLLIKKDRAEDLLGLIGAHDFLLHGRGCLNQWTPESLEARDELLRKHGGLRRNRHPSN